MRTSLSLRLLAAAAVMCLCTGWPRPVLADTEQAHVGPFLCFADPLGVAAEEAAARLASSWPVLRSASVPSTFSLPISQQTRREVGSDEVDSKLGAWVVLDLHASSNAHTLRAAWPGSYPAEITLSVFDTESMLARGGMETTVNETRSAEDQEQPRDLRFQRPCKRAFAQIIAWRKGKDDWPSPLVQHTQDAVLPLHLTLEPLLLGAAPRTAILFLVATLLPLLANKGKGGKNRRRGKNENENEKRELVFKEEGQEYAQVIKMLGNGRLEAQCFDGEKRLAHIRGKLRKKVWIGQGDIILLSLRDFQDDKADVIQKYSSDEARSLKQYGELPESAKINETDTFGEDEGGDVEFEEASDDDLDDI
ncbi:Translation initiation factor 1A [Tilletia horrida]|uniref:Eukaryotic translation initiation factor 1A n=1 Tax=Tilletia horrida TaxID=155126 RepID=A0AAN6JJZ5_9BASI|nr:Translation initiation factor 1A [Tilletia horrida]